MRNLLKVKVLSCSECENGHKIEETERNLVEDELNYSDPVQDQINNTYQQTETEIDCDHFEYGYQCKSQKIKHQYKITDTNG